MVSRLKLRLTVTLTLGASLVIMLIVFFIVFSFYRQNSNSIYAEMTDVFECVSDEDLQKIIPDTLPEKPDSVLNLAADLDFGSNVAVFVANFDTSFIGSLRFPFILSDGNVPSETVNRLAQTALNIAESNEAKGVYGFNLYMKKAYSAGTLVLFSDDDTFIGKVRVLISVSLAILAVGLLASVWIARIVADWLTKPVEETLENQSTFISDVSHELKTPLAVITANADALETETGENKWLSSIKNESLRMAGLITELLDASRLERNDDTKTFTDTDLSSVVNETIMTFDALAFEKGVLIESDVSDGVTVLGSPEKLRRLTGILFDNAVKYVNEGGSIYVKLYHRLGTAVLIVRNTGSFVKKEDRKKIFDRFFRADESRAKEGTFGSYGLGLSIARSIVEEHNGDIVCQSVAGDPDVTTFKVTI